MTPLTLTSTSPTTSTAPSPTPAPSSTPSTSKWDESAARHLLNRAGFGGPPDQVRELAALGCKGAVARLIDFGSIPWDGPSTDDIRSDIHTPLSPEERREVQRIMRGDDAEAIAAIRERRNEIDQTDRKQVRVIQEWWFRRMLESPRPMEEKMTLFWHGHFASGIRTVKDSYHMYLQNQLFRRMAVGNFATLVHEIIRDPAMLKYLDADENRRQRPNENLAREVMELFVLGEGHGYTEADIKEGARALTGHSFHDDEAIFRRPEHDAGIKTIMGQTGAFDGDGFMDIILARPEASEFIASKLYRFFVNDSPGAPTGKGAALCQDLARTMRGEKYDLKPVLTQLFTSEHFYDAANRGAVVKSPVQLLVQASRELGLPARNPQVVGKGCAFMGQFILEPPNVKGWAGGRSWISTSTLFARQNTMLYMLSGQGRGRAGGQPESLGWDPLAVVAHVPQQGDRAAICAAVVDAVLDRCLSVAPSAHSRSILSQTLADSGGTLDQDRVLGLLCLACALPEYQLC